MNKKFVVFVLFFLLMVTLVVAAPPTTTIFTGDTGFNINVNIMQFYQVGEARYSVIHVFNQTNGFIQNSSNSNISCTVYLRDSQGFEVMEVTAEPHGDHWDLNGSGGGANPIGSYAWTISCNDYLQEQGGYASGTFRITADGEDDSKTDASSGISATIFILFITLGLFVLPFVKKFSKLDWTNNIIRRGCWTIALFVLMFNSAILSTIAEEANLNIVSEFFRYMLMFGWAGYVAAAYFVIMSLFEILKHYRMKKEKKRFGDGSGGI